MLKGRSRSGVRPVPTDPGGIKALYQALGRGEMVVILPDQQPKARVRGAGVFAPFFGVPALTMVLVGRLARKTGAPVIFSFAERLPGSAGYRNPMGPVTGGHRRPGPVASRRRLESRGRAVCTALSGAIPVELQAFPGPPGGRARVVSRAQVAGSPAVGRAVQIPIWVRKYSSSGCSPCGASTAPAGPGGSVLGLIVGLALAGQARHGIPAAGPQVGLSGSSPDRAG